MRQALLCVVLVIGIGVGGSELLTALGVPAESLWRILVSILAGLAGAAVFLIPYQLRRR